MLTTVLAMFLYAPGMCGPPMENPTQEEMYHASCGGGNHILLTLKDDANNWTLIVTAVSSNYSLDKVTLTISNENGSVALHQIALMELARSNWHAYGVLYLTVGVEKEVVRGARIVIDRTAHPSAQSYTLMAGGRILTMGTLS